jgi:UDP-glucose 4-epimerase
MTILVTGGAGFIGSHIADWLIKDGMDVVILDDLSGGFVENLPEKTTCFIKGSINDSDLVNKIFEKYSFEYVFHLAAYAAENLSHFIKNFNYTNNLLGSINLLNAAVNFGTKTFVFTSSVAVYGNSQPPMTEEMLPHPEDSYGIAKYAFEQELCICEKMFGLNYIIFRPHNVYGERQNIWDKYRNVIGIFMNQIMEQRPLTLFGDGEQTRAFTYIDDVARIIANSIRVKQAQNEIFNLGSDTPYTINYLAQAVAKSMNVIPQIQYLPARSEVKHVYAAHEKTKRVFNPPPALPLEIGLARMASWVRNAGTRKSKFFDKIEIQKKLPPSWANINAGDSENSF